MKRGVILILLFLLLVLAPSVMAKEGHMKLLAVSQTAEGLKPASADLSLEIKKGKGRVFINTFPLTKVDTQVSFRLAKEFACDFLNYDCGKLDFFYMLRSNSPIVGGPSAGAAATSLTVILLDDLTFDQKSAVTGTINSGGIIGPVAGIKEKIDAANMIGLTKVLIPEGKRFSEINNTNGTNVTIDLVEYGASLGIEVKEVAFISQSVFELTGKNYSNGDLVLELDPVYVETMKKIADSLCQRSKDLQLELNPKDVIDYQDLLAEVENLTISSTQAVYEGSYYSAASYCYSANVKYQYLLLVSQNLTKGEMIRLFDRTEQQIDAANAELEDFEYDTLTDFQTFLVVKERLREAEEHLDTAREFIVNSRMIEAARSLATSIERINSAKSWAEFFGKPGKRFNLDQQSLKQVCLNKIAEADERLQYTSSFFTFPMSDMRLGLDEAALDFDNEDYEICIYKASKIKARTDLIMSSVGLKREDVNRLLDRKLEIVEDVIIKETQRGIFPIMGYSYFEYAKSLSEEDPFSALLYSEFALELSNFNIYFDAEKRFEMPDVNLDILFVFVFGASFGFLFAMSLRFNQKRFRTGLKRKKRKLRRLKRRR